jgi:hypothetical protein
MSPLLTLHREHCQDTVPDFRIFGFVGVLRFLLPGETTEQEHA